MSPPPWLAVPALAIAAAFATRLKPGLLPDGSTLLPSGWRIRPAGRQVTVGTLPLGLATLSDGSVLVTNNGYAENGLMRSEEHTSELQSLAYLVCRLLLEKKKKTPIKI